ncbi:hypothetical protein ABZP36_010434 [Zizania latifolia]
MVVRMQEEGERPDSVTLASVLPACANARALAACREVHAFALRAGLDDLVNVSTAILDAYCKCGDVGEQGQSSIISALADISDPLQTRWVYGYSVRLHLDQDVYVLMALIDMYAKCGRVTIATSLFNSAREMHVIPWNVMIHGCSSHGLGKVTAELFEEMKNIGIVPNETTFLSACSHAGACKLHNNVELAEESAQRIFELGPEVGVYDVLLANIYANASMWKDVARARASMEKKGLQKTPGWSIIQLKNEVHTFYSGSTNHQQAKEIYSRLAKLIEEIKAVGYVPDTDLIHDVEDDVKAQLLNTHSEKLAIAFWLIRTAPGTTIQIKKNLSHNATKLISLVTGREIIMRDIQRFHHFKDGKCSRGDYW